MNTPPLRLFLAPSNRRGTAEIDFVEVAGGGGADGGATTGEPGLAGVTVYLDVNRNG